MESKYLEIVLTVLAEKIRELELELSLRDYDLKKAKEENETLKLTVENLKKALLKEEE
jgi:hypothetical protein